MQHPNRDSSSPRPARPAAGPTPFRLGHCHELLAAVLAAPRIPADAQIARFFAARRYLGSHDRGYIAETVYAVLRGVIALRWLLGLDGLAPAHEAALLLAARLLQAGEPTGETEAAMRALELERRDVERIRALLAEREERLEALEEPERTAMRNSVPVWFAAMVLQQMGESNGGALLGSLGRQAPIALRANTLRTTRERLAEALAQRGIAAEPGVLAPDALILARRMNANAIAEFKDGWFELQDEGSQLLSVVLDPHPNWSVFDACAGAGGKTLHLAAIMRGRGSVTAHDVNERRLAEIKPRLRRSGAQNVRVMGHERYQELRDTLAGTFDAVLVDAPCTGAGVIRRNPGAWLTLDPEMLDRLVVQQAAIVDEYARLVKPGGLLLYATCSVLRQENEDQVARFLADNPGWAIDPRNVPAEVRTAEGFFRCYPHVHGTDAFFGAVLRCPGA